MRKDPNLINFITIVKEKMNLQKSYGSVCVRMKYLKGKEEPAILCVEIDFSKLFKTSSLSLLEKYDFGMFTLNGERIFPIINIDDSIYDIILNQFNNSNRPNQRLFPIGDWRLFTFYHFLYYNLSLSAEQKGLDVNWDEIDTEYNDTIKKILSKLEEYEKNKEPFVILDFNKTICQKKIIRERI
jgi:hypothetical protein